jgi:anti-sigma regulatory factor (Ser/Thr protein kinase)
MFNVILSTREFNGRWVTAFRGELDLADEPGAAAHLSAAVAGYGPPVVVDIAGPEYIGSSGCGMLDHVLRCASANMHRIRAPADGGRSHQLGPQQVGVTGTNVGLSFRPDPHGERSLRPVQVTSAFVPAVSGYDGAAGPAARPKRRAFPGRADQIANARDFTRRVLASCPVLDEATLLVGELATNAVEHTATGSGGQFDVIIYRDETAIIIVVRDEGSDNAPASRPHDELAEDGRGLRLVERMADRWGYCGNERGRTIWLELRCTNR